MAIDSVLLALLRERDFLPDQLVTRAARIAEQPTRPVWRALTRLEARLLVEAYQDNGERVLSLTEAGTAFADREARLAERLALELATIWET